MRQSRKQQLLRMKALKPKRRLGTIRPVSIPAILRTHKILVHFGDMIWRTRIEMGLSRHELARKCNKDYSFIHRIETGQRVTLPRVDEFNRLVVALGLKGEDLLTAAGYIRRLKNK